MFDESKRRRAMRPAVRQSREAMSVVASINDRIGGWQTTIARLSALSRKARLDGRPCELLRAEAEALRSEIRLETSKLSAERRGLPERIANHTRVVDTDRALATIESGLDSVLAQLA
jgi:capsule polysaccharide export protein KpsE/RkpR